MFGSKGISDGKGAQVPKSDISNMKSSSNVLRQQLRVAVHKRALVDTTGARQHSAFDVVSFPIAPQAFLIEIQASLSLRVQISG
jgi:hypothetical protein